MVRKSDKSEASRIAFGKRLSQIRVQKGFRQAELARQAALHMPKKRLGRSLISKYENGEISPSLLALNALAQALGMTVEELNDTPGIAETMPADTKAHFRTLNDDSVFVRVNQRVPRAVGLKIMMMLEESEAEKKGR